ncbi:hypothetical protein, partial [Streptomyces sp. E5N91]|uniref:hypothetical protein n=1 Tax=Streptomyces sp. E5N91 TaxID=1851996 RepID=UPI001EE93558
VPSGSTEYDYRDVYFAATLGSVTVDDSATVQLGTGDSATVSGSVTALAAAPFGVLAAACAGVLVTGLGWLVVQGGSGALDDAASGSAADRSAARPDSPSAGREAAVVFGTPRYLACARLVAEGTVTAADPVPGTARHRITLRVTHAYAPANSAGPATAFVLDDTLARLAPGDRVLVGALRDRPTADTVITGDRNIATARARITASLPESRTLTCD